MTPSKPRLFLVVLATTVASQDGVVAAGDSVRNRRTRPSAEQRLLPDDDHPIPGKCEPRFTLSTKLPARPGGARNASRAGPRVAAARRKRPARAPSRQVFLVTSAASSVGPAARLFPSRSQPCRSQASFLCLSLPPHAALSLPATAGSSYPSSSLRAKRKTGVPGWRAASPQRGKEGKKDSSKCPKEEPAGEGERGRSLSPRVELNPGGLFYFFF